MASGAPQLYCMAGGIGELIMRNCQELQLPFNPTIWAPDPHTQSAMGLLRTLTARGSYTRQLVMTSDHGTLGLDWWSGSDKPAWAAADAPIVLFIHGINGGSHEGYVKWACLAAASRGWRAVVLNMRGCNGLPLTSARGYNAINTADVHVAVQSIHSRFPDAPLLAAGYSLGSVLLAKYIAEADNGLYSQHQPVAVAAIGSSDSSSSSTTGESVPQPSKGSGLVAAALVSPPVCLHTTNSKMGQPYTFKFLYNLAVAYKLREYVKEHVQTIRATGMHIDTDAMLNSWTVASFDDAVTLKALGYPSPHLYYRHACSTNYIPHIRTPTLILLSKDDPFLGIIPQQQVQNNPFTVMAATRRGGHLAFLQGWWPLGQSYCDTVIDGWLSAALQEWRHGSSINPQQRPSRSPALQPAAGLRQQPQGAAAQQQPQRNSAGSSSLGVAGGFPSLAQQRQRLPSWVERAVAAGLLDPEQHFDPTSLSDILCSCNPELQPVQQAHAVDAALNTAVAPATQAAAAAAKAAAAVRGSSSSSSSSSTGAKHSWLFGFGRSSPPAAPTTPGSALPGLHSGGAWEPFGGDGDADGVPAVGGSSRVYPIGIAAVADTAAVAETTADAGSSGSKQQPAARTGLWGRWWGGGGSQGPPAAAGATDAGSSSSSSSRQPRDSSAAQLRSRL